MSTATSDQHCSDRRISVARWEPPADAELLGELLSKLRSWQPLDGEAVLDDIAAALDDMTPDEAEIAELVQRLCGHLARLTAIAVAAKADQRDAPTAALVQRGRVLRSVDVAGDRAVATHHLRRIGWVTNELMEALVAAKCLKEAA
ncbi:DUF6415 family natural product biosynthesis protein [Phytoactinopolyspora mesophila]|uniref:DUF6415 family natural product biosynthesis protein n=1 Tax=Phytoactinopolyspora mesophila TaxID=2650750 RepID=UPI001C9E5450|nr:DUF6415 family natural product biosynthesis protein [Phytoactinopolyspora mesophila]